MFSFPLTTRIVAPFTLSVLLAMTGCGGDELEEPGAPGSSSSSSSSSSGAPLTGVVLPARVQAQNYVSFGGEDDKRDGDTTGACSVGEVDMQAVTDMNGGCHIGWTRPGEWVAYTVAATAARTYDVTLRIAANTAGQTVTLLVDGAEFKTATVPGDGWQVYRDVVIKGVQLSRGDHTVAVRFETGQTNFNFLEFKDAGGVSSSSSSSSSTGGPISSDAIVIPARINADAYTSQVGEDATRSGDTTGICKHGVVDLIIVGSECAIGYTVTGESVTYKVHAPATARYNFKMEVASGSENDSELEVYANGDLKSRLLVKNNGWDTYVTMPFLGAKLNAGDNNITIKFVNGGINLLAFKIEERPDEIDPGPGGGGFVGDASRGRDIWDAQCGSSCHGINGNSAKLADADLVGGTATLELLVASIQVSMPLINPSACVDQCAADVSAYIAIANPFFNRVGSDGVVHVDRLGEYPVAKNAIDARPVPIARLNIRQYNNTVRDLFGTNIRLGNDFPVDPRAGLFDNDALALFTSLDHIKAYHNTATKLVDEAFAGTGAPNPKVVSCSVSGGESCARTVATEFGKKAWRRPLTAAEVTETVDRYKVLRNQSANNRDALKLMVKGMILSPKFLFRHEVDPNLASTTPRALNAYELASRLSYFIWSSMPDDALMAAADNGSLTTSAELDKQITRMLADAKATSLVDGFAAQWLDYPSVVEAQRDSAHYPLYNDKLVESMIGETREFMNYIIKNNRTVREIVDADYTFLNAPLANLYGLSGISGDNLRRHNWGSEVRRYGVLSHASIMTSSAGDSAEPAPVLRGVWVLDRLLCKKPRPATSNVMDLFPVLSEDLSGRERLELHRTNPVCANCHALMDPIGFGLENYDSIGAWRDTVDGETLDTSGDLPGGVAFTGPIDLKMTLSETEELPFCFSNHMATYALGRPVNAYDYWVDGKEPSDYAFVFNVYNQTKASGHKVGDIIKAIVMSDAFRKRRGAETVGENQ